MKTRIKKWLVVAGTSLMAGSGLLFVPGCAVHGGVAYEGTPGPYYDYDYYPDANVYYYAPDRVYYWNEGGRWISGGALPPRYALHHEHVQHYRYRTREPWTERKETIKEHYHD